MEQTITTKWQSDMHFKAHMPPGIDLDMDSSEEFGGTGKGYRPKALMLSALAGCTGLDVASLLKKMRVIVDGFEIEIIANLTEDHPKQYSKVHVNYIFYGENLKEEKIEKAINLSIDKYCGVIAMFKQFAEMSFEVEYNPE